MEGQKALSHQDMPADEQHFRMTSGLMFLVTTQDKEDSDRIADLVTRSDKFANLVGLVAEIANRVLRSIRNFGTAPHIVEFNPRLQIQKNYSAVGKLNIKSPTEKVGVL